MPSDTATRDRPEYAFMRLPRCDCGSKRLLAYKSIDQGDGSRARYTRCAECGRKIVVIVE